MMARDGTVRLLLDTHVWIWRMNGEPQRVGAATIAAIERAATSDSVYVSALSVWEVALLDSKGRIRLSRDCSEWVHLARAAPGAQLLPLSPDTAVASGAEAAVPQVGRRERLRQLPTRRHASRRRECAGARVVGFGAAKSPTQP